MTWGQRFILEPVGLGADRESAIRQGRLGAERQCSLAGRAAVWSERQIRFNLHPEEKESQDDKPGLPE